MLPDELDMCDRQRFLPSLQFDHNYSQFPIFHNDSASVHLGCDNFNFNFDHNLNRPSRFMRA
jgi:hypothetical protein